MKVYIVMIEILREWEVQSVHLSLEDAEQDCNRFKGTCRIEEHWVKQNERKNYEENTI